MADTPTTTKRNPLGKQFGRSGTQIFGGYITAEDYNSDLTGKRALRNYDIMTRSDTTVESIVKLVTLPLMGLIWDIEAASDDEQDQIAAKFCKYDLMERNVNWDAFMDEALTFLPMGFSCAEKTYELIDYEGAKMLGTNNVTFLKQTSIEKWQMDNGQLGVQQLLLGDNSGAAGTNYANIPMAKLMVFTHKRKGDNYEGVSMLRPAFKDWDMKDKLGLVMAVGLEKQAIPTPLLTTPPNPDKEQLDRAIELIQQFRANEKSYLQIPTGWTLDKFDLSGQTTKEILPAIKYYDHQMQMSILAPFMGLGGEGSSGSRAVGDVQYKPYILQEEAVAKEFARVVQEQWIRQLCDLNFSNLKNGYPKLIHSKLSDENVTEIADYVSKLSSASALTVNFETEQHLRKVGGLPELTDDDKLDYEEKQKEAAEARKNALEAPSSKPEVKPKDIKAAVQHSKRVRKILVNFLDEE